MLLINADSNVVVFLFFFFFFFFFFCFFLRFIGNMLHDHYKERKSGVHD